MGGFESRFKNKKVAVLGAGREGLAMAKFLLENGAVVELRDRKTEDQLRHTLTPTLSHKERGKIGVNFRCGEDYLKGLDQFDMIVRSPGIPWLTPELVRARERGVEVTSQIDQFLRLCPAKVIGVTGTKGKSTTSSLIAHILSTAGKKNKLGGNIGEPIINWLESISPDQFVVLELSSFQLQGLNISPPISVVLDITTEHLDHHLTREEYVESKQNVTLHQNKNDIAVLDADSLTTTRFASETKAKVWWFSGKKYVDSGVFVKEIDGDKYFVVSADGVEKTICRVEDLNVQGEHNYCNAAAAATVALALGIDIQDIAKGFKSFSGLPHRMQRISGAMGRDWIDDAYATAPDSTCAALNHFKTNSIILVVGGSFKGYTFEALGEKILSVQPKVVVTIGQTGPGIEQTIRRIASLKDVNLPKIVSGAKNMDDIIHLAIDNSVPGDLILFSPGCASFGMFENVADRAKQFSEAVAKLEG